MDTDNRNDGLDLPESLRRTTEAQPEAPATTEAPVAPPVEAQPEAPAQATTEAPAIPAPAKPLSKRAAKRAAKRSEKAAKAEAKTEAAEGDKPVRRRSIVPVRFKQQYAATRDTCGDRLALAFKDYTTTVNDDGREALDLEKLAEVATANGIDLSKYDGLNNGQKRMNVGNKLRGLIKNDETVTIGKRKFAKSGLVKDAIAA